MCGSNGMASRCKVGIELPLFRNESTTCKRLCLSEVEIVEVGSGPGLDTTKM